MRRLITLALLGYALLVARAACADSVLTDANIVTGLDFSGSIEASKVQIQIDGIAMAIRSPQIVAAIQHGKHKRIGFALFIWADGTYPVLAEWHLIGSAQDALAVSQEVANRLDAILGSDILAKLGAPTDVSGALDYAGAMLRAAPFFTERQIVNIIGDGVDNVGEGPATVRSLLLAQGVTINGVALGHDPIIYEYFKRQLIGGPNAFVLTANEPSALVKVLARKFVTEIAMTDEPTRSFK